MKASDKRKAAQQRNIDRKAIERREAIALRQAQALSNDTELKTLCARIAMIQERPITHDEVGLEKLRARAETIYKNFRMLSPMAQRDAWVAGLKYVKNGGDASEFLNFRGIANDSSGDKKLEECTEQN